MTKEKAIKYLRQIYPNGGGTWLDEQRIEAISMAIAALEEPVSGDLKDAAQQYAKYTAAPPSDVAYHFVSGANWQKDQFEKNRLAACERLTREEAEREQDFVMSIFENEHRQPTYSDAIEYGMRVQKQQMMKNSFDAVVCKGGNTYLREMDKDAIAKALVKYNDGDKVKVIIIKED